MKPMPAVDVWFADTQSPRGVWAIQLQVNAHCSYVMCTSNSKRKRIKIHEVAGHEAGSSLPALYSYSPTNRMCLEVGLNHYLDLLGCEFETSTVQGLNVLVFPLSTWTLNVPQDQQHFGHRTLFFSLQLRSQWDLGIKLNTSALQFAGSAAYPFPFRALTFVRFMSVLRVKWRLRRTLT